MAVTKDQIIQQLTDAGITFDPNATVAELRALLPASAAAADDAQDASDAANTAPAAPTAPATPVAPVPTVDSERQARWQDFLAKARDQREDKTIFDAQMKRGEFDTIPDSFV